MCDDDVDKDNRGDRPLTKRILSNKSSREILLEEGVKLNIAIRYKSPNN